MQCVGSEMSPMHKIKGDNVMIGVPAGEFQLRFELYYHTFMLFLLEQTEIFQLLEVQTKDT